MQMKYFFKRYPPIKIFISQKLRRTFKLCKTVWKKIYGQRQNRYSLGYTIKAFEKYKNYLKNDAQVWSESNSIRI